MSSYNVTICDIAKMAGVSVTTVSRVLNNKGYVSAETRECIEALIKEYNYRPNAVARSLIRRNTEMIAVILPGRMNPFFAQILDAVDTKADREHQSVLFYNTAEDPDKEYEAVTQAIEHRVRGILILPVMNCQRRTAELLSYAESSGISVVLVDRDVPAGSFNSVFIDNSQVVYDAVQILFKAGHREIGIISCPETLTKGRGRLDGYRRFLLEHGISEQPEYIYKGKFDEESGYEALQYFFNMEKPPTAVLATCSSATLGCIRYLNEKGLKAGEDIGLIGFDDIALLNAIGYQVTVADRPMREMSDLAYDMLMEASLKEKQPQKKVLLKPRILLRGSEKMKTKERIYSHERYRQTAV